MAALIDKYGIGRAAMRLRIDPRTLRRWAREAGVYRVRSYQRRSPPEPRPWWRRLIEAVRR